MNGIFTRKGRLRGKEAPKRVLIMMSDTGGGHRASAQAIKAGFEQLYGKKYQVLLLLPYPIFFLRLRLWTSGPNIPPGPPTRSPRSAQANTLTGHCTWVLSRVYTWRRMSIDDEIIMIRAPIHILRANEGK
eukprot:scaffold215059_cov37-Prasinocladus_malaysianus.AAC.1